MSPKFDMPILRQLPRDTDRPLKAIRKARTLDAYLDAANALFRDCDLIPGGKFVFRP